MFTRFRLPLVALVLAAPAGLAAQSVRDFQLPPNPTPTASPNVQGPVDSEGVVPVRPRVIATPTPTPAPRPTPSASVQPVPTPAPTPSATSTPRSTAPQPTAPRVSPQPRSVPTAQERLPLDPGETAPIVPAPVPTDEATPVPTPSATSSEPVATPAAEESAEGIDWLWPAVGGGLLALLGLGYFVSQRRRNAPPPEIERPIVATASGKAAPHEIQISAEAIKLTRSVMNATLHYRVSLINRSPGALKDVDLGADIVSAHGGLPVEQQVASASQTLEKRHTFARIAPGQTVRFEGQITIPLSQARVIRQGNAALFVPLLRVRLDGASEEPLVRTFVVGLGVPGGGRVMPFRIDEGPRSYEPIAARALD
ncbi:hypothetical protein K3152_00020 [Qipengyuania sp. 1NDH17]|uniref:LPXTG cell wall anchor domain-containing protein n=1 Tax=Qipengyuania polymorpha TaxID=2867234 RepID=A0ABS7ITF3_9SPHN|nr:hypothetical protein [Qipengyuania polymorpha]MBX7456622.1 hypothetical protein [Qipengyuania polymorpha]